MDFARVLRVRRMRRSWTQAELAERAGVSVRTITSLESGRAHPRPETVRLLADALVLADRDREAFLAAASGEIHLGTGAVPDSPRPAQLPADLGDFTGRAEDLAALDALLPAGGGGGGAKMLVLAGSAGVGKTAMAVRWAHRVADRFPDGQLYLNLHGFAQGQPVRPIEALAGFLGAVGVPADRIPPQEESAAALYRSLLAGRRMLVLLDNAADADQVRLLLPGGAGNLALVTSRRMLTGLVVSHGAHQQTLAPLAPDDAAALIIGILGADRTAQEPGAVGDLVEACSRLPLALRIAAATVRADGHLTIREYLAELREGDRLGQLSVEGDPTASVRTAFSWSYVRLLPPVQRLFRLLSLVPGPYVSVEAAAALAGLDRAAASLAMLGLVDAHLLDRYADRQYGFHDLLRDFAAESTQEADSDSDRDAALRRLLDWYLHGTVAAVEVLAPAMLRLPTPAPTDGIATPRHQERAAALGWLETERRNLVAAVTHAATQGLHEPAWLLGDALRGYFDTTGHMIDWMTVAHATAAAANAAGDLAARSAAASNLAGAYTHNHPDDHGAAILHGTDALLLARMAGWAAGEARALNHLAVLHGERGRLDTSIELFTEALALDRRMGNRTGEAIRLMNLGVAAELAGRLHEALEYLQRAFDIPGTRIDIDTFALANLGEVQRLVGAFDAANDSLTRAVAAGGRDGVRRGFSLAVLADLCRDRGNLAEAREHADAAEAVAAEAGDRRNGIWAINSRAAVDLRAGQPESAAARYEQVLRDAGDQGFVGPRAAALIGLATARRQLGQLDDATAHAARGLELAHRGGYRVYEGEAHAALAEIHLERHRATGDPSALERASSDAEAALALQRATGHRVGEARSLIIIGHIAHAASGPPAATPSWRAALALCTELGLAEASELTALLRGPTASGRGRGAPAPAPTQSPAEATQRPTTAGAPPKTG